MNSTSTGWIVGIAAVGMMCGLLAVDISQFKTWAEVFSPGFIGAAMGHFAVVITAFIGGKLIPTTRDVWTPEQRAAQQTKTGG